MRIEVTNLKGEKRSRDRNRYKADRKQDRRNKLERRRFQGAVA